MGKFIKGKINCARCSKDFIWVEQIRTSGATFRIHTLKENEEWVRDGNMVYCPKCGQPNFLKDEDRKSTN